MSVHCPDFLTEPDIGAMTLVARLCAGGLDLHVRDGTAIRKHRFGLTECLSDPAEAGGPFIVHRHACVSRRHRFRIFFDVLTAVEDVMEDAASAPARFSIQGPLGTALASGPDAFMNREFIWEWAAWCRFRRWAMGQQEDAVRCGIARPVSQAR